MLSRLQVIKESLKNKKVQAGTALLAASLSTQSNAALDLTGITGTGGAIEAVGGNMELVGIGIIGLAVTALGIAWVKATFF